MPKRCELRNYMEDVVSSLVDGVVDSTGTCKCEECRLDIIAITLNHLKPKYVVTKKGTLYAKVGLLQHQNEVDAISEITRAIEQVSKYPRHDLQDAKSND